MASNATGGVGGGKAMVGEGPERHVSGVGAQNVENVKF